MSPQEIQRIVEGLFQMVRHGDEEHQKLLYLKLEEWAWRQFGEIKEVRLVRCPNCEQSEKQLHIVQAECTRLLEANRELERLRVNSATREVLPADER